MEGQLRAKYNPEGSVLRSHQLRMLEILIDIDRVCKENGIDYWLSDGTLLGAVRHGGFIPWDDDLDIQMFDKDYRNFVDVMRNKPIPYLDIQINATDKMYVAPYAKIRDVKSEISECKGIDKNYKYRGIYIDVFCMIYASPFLTRLSNYLQYHLLYNPSHKKRNFFLSLGLKLSYGFLSVLFRLFSIIDSLFLIKQINYTYGSCFKAYNYLFDDIFPLSRIEFEGFMFNAPNKSKQVLEKTYGDYMELPPESDRRVHTDSVLVKYI